MKFTSTIFFLFILLNFPMVYGQDQALKNKTPEDFHVALLIDKLDSFWTNFVRVMQTAASQFNIQLSVYHGNESHLAMIRQVDQLAHGPKKPEILLFKSFKGNGQKILAMAEFYQIKTLAINSPLTPPNTQALDLNKFPSFIGELLPDDEQAGYELVTSLRSHMLSKGIDHIHLLAINGEEADAPATLRKNGLIRAVNEFADVTLHQIVYDSWTPKYASTQFKVLIKRYPMANAVWGGNDALALVMIEQAKEMLLVPGQDIFFGGIDISPEGLEAVSKNELVVSVGGHILDGGWSMVLIHDFHRSGKLEQNRWLTAMTPVTAKNVASYQKLIDTKGPVPIDFTKYSSRTSRGSTKYDFKVPID
ncbi:MAG: ABC transporter substrate-binding protein [Oligoflexus sp.]